jgi:hypothetical protein
MRPKHANQSQNLPEDARPPVARTPPHRHNRGNGSADLQPLPDKAGF